MKFVDDDDDDGGGGFVVRLGGSNRKKRQGTRKRGKGEWTVRDDKRCPSPQSLEDATGAIEWFLVRVRAKQYERVCSIGYCMFLFN